MSPGRSQNAGGCTPEEGGRRTSILGRRLLTANPVAGEPQADHADEDGEDEAQRVRRQGEGEHRAEDFAREVRELLASRSPEGVFWDWPGDTEVVLAVRS